MGRVPQAVTVSNQGTIDLPGVEGQNLSWRDNAPLYSMAAFDNAALPAETSLFSYAVGQTVSGAGNGAIQANTWHTNMRIPRSLPSPEVFAMDRVRIIVIPGAAISGGEVQFQSTVQTVAAALTTPTFSPLMEDLNILQALTVRLEMENKRYLDAPLWFCPANTGFAGVAAYSVSYTAAATSVAQKSAAAVHMAGEGWRFSDSLPPILTSNTVLDFRLLYQHPGTAPSLQLDRYVLAYISGRHGRAVR